MPAPSSRQTREAFEAAMQSMVQRFESLGRPALRSLAPVLAKAQRDLETGLAEWLATQSNEARFTVQRMRQALLQVRGGLDTIRRLEPTLLRGLDATANEAGALATEMVTEQMLRFSNLFDGSMRIVDVEKAAVLARGKDLLLKRYEGSAKRYAGTTLRRVKQEFALAALKGQSIGETARRLEKALPRVFEIQRNAAARLVRTESMHAYNTHHHEALRELRRDPENRDIKMRWDASMDRRLCVICNDLHGKVTEVKGEFLREEDRVSYVRPPAHPNCRCIIVAWSSRWEKAVPPDERDKEEKPKPRKRKKPAEPAKKAKPKKKAPKPEPKSKVERVGVFELSDAEFKIDDKNGLSKKRLVDAFEKSEGVDLSKDPDTQKIGKKHRSVAESIRKETHRAMREELGLVGSRRTKELSTGYFVETRPGAYAYNASQTNTIIMSDDAHAKAMDFTRKAAAGKWVNPQDLGGINVLIHEELHSYGPSLLTRTPTYKGPGAIIEEVTTEVSARQYVRRKYKDVSIQDYEGRVGKLSNYSGVQTSRRKFGQEVRGGYQELVEETVDGLMEAFDISGKEATELLEQVSLDIKRSRWVDPVQLSAEMARSGKRRGLGVSVVEERTRNADTFVDSFLSLAERRLGKTIDKEKRAGFVSRISRIKPPGE